MHLLRASRQARTGRATHHAGVFAEVDLDGGLVNTLQVEHWSADTAAASGPEARQCVAESAVWEIAHHDRKRLTR